MAAKNVQKELLKTGECTEINQRESPFKVIKERFGDR